jgi:histidine triad (HIT) family protein
MDDCIFCRIVNGESRSKPVYEDERVFAFEDINPQAPTHILVIPKKHIASLGDVTEAEKEILGELMLRAREIARSRGLDRKGYRLVLNTGPWSGQSVFHIHLHLLGGRPMGWPPG